jgi:LuxR family maltose regulon positive regulatory protein
MEDGDEEAEKKWLLENANQIYSELQLYKLYQHFTTARAYIATGDFDGAVLFAKKLEILCRTYRRTLDMIEAKVLLSIAFWKKGRGYQKEALDLINETIISANKYGYTRVFTNEGAELINMLHRVESMSVQKEYSDKLPIVFIKTLYFAALAQSKTSKGLTAGRISGILKFTKPQKKVMEMLCRGLSRSEIAESMNISVYGVRSHLKLIYKKLDVPNGIEAIMKIKELELLSQE